MLSPHNIRTVSSADTVWPLSSTLICTPSGYLSYAHSGHQSMHIPGSPRTNVGTRPGTNMGTSWALVWILACALFVGEGCHGRRTAEAGSVWRLEAEGCSCGRHFWPTSCSCGRHCHHPGPHRPHRRGRREYPSHLDHFRTTSRRHLDHISTTSRPHLDHMCKLYAYCMHGICMQ